MNLSKGLLDLVDQAAILAPEPSVQQIESEYKIDMTRDPHNDKGLRRSTNKIIWDLRYQHTLGLIKAKARHNPD